MGAVASRIAWNLSSTSSSRALVYPWLLGSCFSRSVINKDYTIIGIKLATKGARVEKTPGARGGGGERVRLVGGLEFVASVLRFGETVYMTFFLDFFLQL